MSSVAPREHHGKPPPVLEKAEEAVRPPLYPAAVDDGTQEPTQLVELLTRASEVIREERAKVSALRECVRGVLAAYAADRTAATASTAHSPRQPSALAAYVQKELEVMESLLGSGAESGGVVGKAVAAVPVSPQDSVTAARREREKRPASVAAAAPPSSSSAGATPRGRQQTPQSYAEQQQRRNRTPSQSSVAAASANATGPAQAAPHAEPPATAPHEEEECVGQLPLQEQQARAMAHRLRRALAPAPTREQLSEVVDAMVRALQQDLRSRPLSNGERTVSLTRVGPCAYQLLWGTADAVAHAQATRRRGSSASSSSLAAAPAASRTSGLRRGEGPAPLCRQRLVHLTVDSGKLCVCGGGGHVNFLEYIEKSLGVKV